MRDDQMFAPLKTLTLQQQNAIEHLLAGENDCQTAEKVGVHRTTVARWRLYHPAFCAELNRRREELWGASAERLRAMLPKALETLASQMESKSGLAAAVSVIRLTGLHRQNLPTGPVETEQVIAQLTEERFEEKDEEELRYMPRHEFQNYTDNPEHDQGRHERIRRVARLEVLHELRNKLVEEADED